ncbi:DUF4283 domain-containing protein [Raphanus sativus]|nr:DUF4283 domain-containing protein [Raphanus sativus]
MPSSTPSPPTLAEKLRVKGDKSLKRVAPVTIYDTSRPRVLIPDSVFQKGAELHKDFIICYFNGRPPPFNQIQSVLSHMWGKGRRLEIHNNPLQRSAIFRIPSEYLRQKILEKNIWYVGDSCSIPLNGRRSTHQRGLLSVPLRFGLILPEFHLTCGINTDSVEVDLTKPLPKVVEFVRQSGEELSDICSTERQSIYPIQCPSIQCCFCSSASSKKTASASQKETPKKSVGTMQYVAVKKTMPKATPTTPTTPTVPPLIPSLSLSLPSSP